MAELRVTSFDFVEQGYVEVDGTLSASFPRGGGVSGDYEVPVRLLYPKDAQGFGGIGVEDLPNAFFFNYPRFRHPRWNISFAKLMLTDRFLMRQRVFFASVTWDKKAVDATGRGHLDRPEDAVHVIRDAARLLRDPSQVTLVEPPTGFVAPTCRAEHVIAYGFSDSGSVLRNYLVERPGDELLDGIEGEHGTGEVPLPGTEEIPFDAALVHAAGATCWSFHSGQFVPHSPRLAKDMSALVISVDSETDVQVQRAAEARQDHDRYRHYEIAGAAHVPKEEFDLMVAARWAAEEGDSVVAESMRATAEHQNPEAMGPVVRAAFHHLREWLTGRGAPPENACIEPSSDEAEVNALTIERDDDGNALGGIRLPWLTTKLEDGSTVGAAVGRHDGLDPKGSAFVGGYYECFDDLRTRYPPGEFQRLLTAGANYARSRRWILQGDEAGYIEKAGRDVTALPCPPWDP